MPFGLHRAAATFQRLVDWALGECKAFAQAYIDNIIISSVTWREHLQHLHHVLQALDKAGLKANLRESHLGFQELKYLGYLVGRGCLKPLPNEVWALERHPQPNTKKQLQQFLGFVRYYSHFIPGYASFAGPLTALDPIQWTPEAEESFQLLHHSLSRKPILHNLDFSQPFDLATDASGTGIGAVLSQGEGALYQPILFISCKLTGAEYQYTTVEKEALAIKWIVGTFHYYLLHNPFSLWVNHKPLKWIASMKDRNAQILRWYLSLLPFSFTVRHQPRSEHDKPSYLSCWPTMAETPKGGGGTLPQRIALPQPHLARAPPTMREDPSPAASASQRPSPC